MPNYELHEAKTRGHVKHAWLDTYHSFSFSSYYNPARMHFGALRVLNDDTIAPGEGFGKHPHDNMEIVTIPLEGELEHLDNMGHKEILKRGDIQVMSAGSGIYHSEFNMDKTTPLKLLQIWIMTNKKDAELRYDQRTIDFASKRNELQMVISPNQDNGNLWLHQNAWFSLGFFNSGFSEFYNVKHKNNGVYAFIIKGTFSIDGHILNDRDALGLWDISSFAVEAKSDNSEILLIDIPMSINNY